MLYQLSRCDAEILNMDSENKVEKVVSCDVPLTSTSNLHSNSQILIDFLREMAIICLPIFKPDIPITVWYPGQDIYTHKPHLYPSIFASKCLREPHRTILHTDNEQCRPDLFTTKPSGRVGLPTLLHYNKQIPSLHLNWSVDQPKHGKHLSRLSRLHQIYAFITALH